MFAREPPSGLPHGWKPAPQSAIPAGTPGAGALAAADDRATLSNLTACLSATPAAAEQRPSPGWPTSYDTGLRYKNIVDDKKPSSIGAYDPGTGGLLRGQPAGRDAGFGEGRQAGLDSDHR
ncbi:hypothetical protein ACFXPX_03380 [Kitasatospora sp. NPDC059146]|uniref:hypothetical protein n=1 Tax=unclassified Kitasatospora TaxID=2633591 RepID=UPI0036A3A7EF